MFRDRHNKEQMPLRGKKLSIPIVAVATQLRSRRFYRLSWFRANDRCRPRHHIYCDLVAPPAIDGIRARPAKVRA